MTQTTGYVRRANGFGWAGELPTPSIEQVVDALVAAGHDADMRDDGSAALVIHHEHIDRWWTLTWDDDGVEEDHAWGLTGNALLGWHSIGNALWDVEQVVETIVERSRGAA